MNQLGLLSMRLANNTTNGCFAFFVTWLHIYYKKALWRNNMMYFLAMQEKIQK